MVWHGARCNAENYRQSFTKKSCFKCKSCAFCASFRLRTEDDNIAPNGRSTAQCRPKKKTGQIWPVVVRGECEGWSGLGQDGLDLGRFHEAIDALAVLEHDGRRAPDRGLQAKLLVAIKG